MLCQGAKVQTTVQEGSWQTQFTTTTIIIIIIILIFCNIFIFVNSGRDSGPLPLGTRRHLLPARHPAGHGADSAPPAAPGNFCVRSC